MSKDSKFKLVCSIVEEDKGSEVLHIAKEIGISGGTVSPNFLTF